MAINTQNPTKDFWKIYTSAWFKVYRYYIYLEFSETHNPYNNTMMEKRHT